MRLSTPNPSPSAKGPTNGPAGETEEERKIRELAATLDTEFPSVIVPGADVGIDEPAQEYGVGREKPDFVKADDAGWA